MQPSLLWSTYCERPHVAHTRLLERCTQLLEIVARVAIENGLYSLHEEIQKLLEKGNVATSR